MMTGQTNMTATERLRALLDERGVRWSAVTPRKTKWYSPVVNGPVAVGEWNDKLVLDTGYVDVTPEQAIAATLGPGACHIDLVGYNEREDRFQCSSCDWSMWFKHGTWPRFNYCPNCGRKVVE